MYTKQELMILEQQVIQNQVVEEINNDFKEINNPQARAYLQRLKKLEDENPNTPSKLTKLLTLIHLHGIQLDDPLFLILLELDIIKEFASDIPDSLAYWLQKIDREIEIQAGKIKADIGQEWRDYLEKEYSEKKEQYQLLLDSLSSEKENVIFKSIKENVLKTLQELQTINQFSSFSNLTRITLALSLIMGSLFGAFYLGKVQESEARGRIKLTKSGEYTLTSDEITALEWAKSPQGIKAKNLFEWNKDWLWDCEKTLKSSNYQGINLVIGDKKANKGYCLLWTRPYEERF